MKITEKQLLARIESWKSALEPLGIGSWRIDSLQIVDSDEFWASVQPSGQYDRFKLRFERTYLAETEPQELDETIVHELLHVAMRDLDNATDRAVNYAPGGDDGELGITIRNAREALVHRLAVLIVAQEYRD